MSQKIKLQISLLLALLNCIDLIQCNVSERSPDYLRETEKFRKLTDSLEKAYLSGKLANELTSDDFALALAEYKSWNPKLSLQVQFTEPQASLVAMLLALWKSYPNVEELRRFYRVIRSTYGTRTNSPKVIGRQILTLADKLLLGKLINKSNLIDALYEFNFYLDELKNYKQEEGAEKLENILSLISRVDVQIISDFIFPMLSEEGEVGPQDDDQRQLNFDEIRKLFLEKYNEQGWSVENGRKKFLFENYYRQLLKEMQG